MRSSRIRSVVAAVSVCAWAGLLTLFPSAPVGATENEAKLPVLIEALRDTVLPSAEPERRGELGSPRLADQLAEVVRVFRERGAWAEAATTNGLFVDHESVLVEIRLDPDYADVVASNLEAEGARIRSHVVPGLIEAWVPVTKLERVAGFPDVHRVMQARLVQTRVGASTSQGVAASNADTYHALGADGTGVALAVIDAGFEDYTLRQASGDWPSGGQLTRYEVSGGTVTTCGSCPGFDQDTKHGTATVELNYDMAPGAGFHVYKTTFISDWYAALVHAADNGVDVVSCSLGAPLDGVGDGTACPPNWSAPCGTIAEAAAYARGQNTLVVNSAGNGREIHWGGDYMDNGSAPNTHDWGAGGNVNPSNYCRPNGRSVSISLFWDDWTVVDHDYDLYLYEYNGSGWTRRAASEFWQNGTPGQSPQEYISYTVTGALGDGVFCPVGTGWFGIVVGRYSAATNRNLQVFASGFIELVIPVNSRSLGFPGDSPNVFSTAAIDVSTSVQEPYSSEGPILGPGGTRGTPAHDEPDGASFANVDTEAYGAAIFAGTSAAAPHVAGAAAILMQLRNEKSTNQAADIEALLHDIGLNGDGGSNDLGTPGFDNQHGYGRIKLDSCSETTALTADLWTMFGLPCNARDQSTVQNVLGDDLTGEWEVWRWDASTETYVELASTDSLDPGTGYWILADSGATLDMGGLVPDTSESYPVPVFGEAWPGRPNLISHPFSHNVAWQDVKVFYGGSEHSLAEAESDGKLRGIMWKPYTGSGYTVNDPALNEGDLEAWDGFWVKALDDVELRIPATESFNPSELHGGGTTLPGGGWYADLSVRAFGLEAHGRLGQLADSVDGYDSHDVELFPPFGDTMLTVVFPHPDWGQHAEDYVRDFRRRKRLDEWRFEVRSNRSGKFVLRWQAPATVLRRSVLIDVDSGAIIPLWRAQRPYSFDMKEGKREFIWRVLR